MANPDLSKGEVFIRSQFTTVFFVSPDFTLDAKADGLTCPLVAADLGMDKDLILWHFSRMETTPPFPFTKIDFVAYGPRFHFPTVWPCVWEADIPHYNFWFMFKGVGRMQSRGREYRLEPGTCFLFTPGSRVLATYSEDIKMAAFAAHFFPAGQKKTPFRQVEPLFGRVTSRMELFLQLAAEAATAYKRGDALGHQQAEWAVLTMMSHLWREAFQSPQASQNDKILEMLRQAAHSPERCTDISALACKAGLSTSQFTRRVREITETTPNNYIIRERIHHACFLLRETSKPVKTIARDLGYSDESFFVRQFRKVLGVTPCQYQRSGKQAPDPATRTR